MESRAMLTGLDHRKQRQTAPSPRLDWMTCARSEVEQSHSQEVVIDFTEVEKISSNELNELIRLQLWVKQSGRRLVLQNLNENLAGIFTLTRLDRLIDVR